MTKNQYDFNGMIIEQRIKDGFLNGTAMCVAHGKDISEWLALEGTLRLVAALASKLGIEPIPGKVGNSVYKRVSATYPKLVIVKRGSPDNGGGTWIHPKLAVHLAQWCSEEFALLVSDWVEEWMTTGRNPLQMQLDSDRVNTRVLLKDTKRLAFTDGVKTYLTQIQRYDDLEYRGKYFAKVHNEINLLLTTETAQQQRVRLGSLLGREVREHELLRDFYPIENLMDYCNLCQATANKIARGMNPMQAIRQGAADVLPLDYQPRPIDFTEHISFARQRLQQGGQEFLPGI